LKAFYVGYTTGTVNHGDEALIWIIRDLLAPEIEVVTSGDDYDIALLGGGTLINQSPWLIDYFASKLEKAKHGIVFGTGVGDLDFWGNHFDRWVPLLQQCIAVGVRGPMSIDLLQQHGFTDAVLTGDPYLWLHAPVQRQPVPRRLGVNIGSTNNSLWGTNDADLANFVFQLLEILAQRGWTFSLMSVWGNDLPLLQDLHTRLGLFASGPVLDARTQPLETYSLLAGCEVFLGEKLHANAMAAVAGTPFVSLEYQPKVRDFAASLGMDQWTISTAERDPRKVAELVETLHERRDEVRDKLSHSHAAQRQALLQFAAHVKRAVLQPEGVR
jgi:polysaccharide pyruvyl transferase WcaK-like protein